jgi:hypothetical protein
VGFPVIQDSKVGFNLQYHICLGNLYFTANSTIELRFNNIPDDLYSVTQYLVSHDGPFSIPGGMEALGFEEKITMTDLKKYKYSM